MRRALFVLILSIAIVNATAMASLVPAGANQSAQPLRLADLLSTEQVLRWINNYRYKPDPASVPDVVKALSRMGAFKDPEQAGPYVGFIAGVIAANPTRAEELISRMFPLPEENHWVVVRAIAYSDHPDWKRLLQVFGDRLATRRVMIDSYMSGKLPTLFQVAPKRSRTMGERVGHYFSYDTYFGEAKKAPRNEIEPSPELLDTFWGYYFATARYRSVARIVAMLPWSKSSDSIELLTLGNMAKFTLASNAVRDKHLLAMLKHALQQEPKPVAEVLREVVDAAETVETARIRKDAMASIEELRRKGPSSRRDVSRWGQVGIGALSLGCIGAAAVGAVALGLPCVLGGAMSSAGLRYWESQQ
jgi:hypothetical protein